jgi:hypothetical protein
VGETINKESGSIVEMGVRERMDVGGIWEIREMAVVGVAGSVAVAESCGAWV